MNMQKSSRLLSLAAAALAALAVLSGCGAKSFSYENEIDQNGYWKGVRAQKLVTLPEYSSFVITSDISTVSDEALQKEIDEILSEYAETDKITDRAVENGDKVNIDYVGSVDGVEFDGGSTRGAGYEVTAGSTEFIGDFLTQIIGHKPGETFDVHVTFPDPYSNNTDLSGKKAVFVTTINYILPELTDEFVIKNFSASQGWATVEQLKDEVRKSMRENAIRTRINDLLAGDVDVKSVPEKLIKGHQQTMIDFYQGYADQYGVSLDEFIVTQVQAESMEALLESESENIIAESKLALVIQAVAEKEKIKADDAAMAAYFLDKMGVQDYSQYEEQYGKGQLRQMILRDLVLEFLAGQVTMA